jgi:hypothetical protein
MGLARTAPKSQLVRPSRTYHSLSVLRYIHSIKPDTKVGSLRGAVAMADDGDDLDKSELVPSHCWIRRQLWHLCLAVVIHATPLGVPKD